VNGVNLPDGRQVKLGEVRERKYLMIISVSAFEI
jgi:hypothetical protein